MTDSNPLTIPDTVKRQLDALRGSGAVNMLTQVRGGLREAEYDEAYNWVVENREAYTEYAMNGGFVSESAAEGMSDSEYDTLDEYEQREETAQ